MVDHFEFALSQAQGEITPGPGIQIQNSPTVLWYYIYGNPAYCRSEVKYEKTALVTGGSSNQSFAIGTFLVNIKKVCPDVADEFVVFHDGKMLERDMQLMSQILPTKLIEYRVPIKYQML